MEKTKGSFMLAAKDYRVWALFVIYAACFGIELTINNIAALYYMDYFDLGIKTAGLVAGLFGLMNIFARTLGGYVSDRFVQRGGLRGRVHWLFIALLAEGIALVFFSQMRVIALAIPVMILFSLFVQMSEGATYSIVPFINKKALGSVAGIVGAGGNMGAVAAGFLFRYRGHLLSTGAADSGRSRHGCCSFFALLVRFKPADEEEAARGARGGHGRGVAVETAGPRAAAQRPHSRSQARPADGRPAHLPRHRPRDQGRLLHHEHVGAGGDAGVRASGRARP